MTKHQHLHHNGTISTLIDALKRQKTGREMSGLTIDYFINELSELKELLKSDNYDLLHKKHL